ncbi:MAG: glutamate-cysteine ligase family protein [Myxococcota bacterium]|nr:glutamate-cysteine ligase family protein [Myxococcota bacterium]
MTLDKRASAEFERPVESIDDLVAYFRAGEKPRERFRIGIEHEKLALRAGSLEPVPYDGENGIEAFLRRVAAQPGFETIAEDGRVMGLDGPASVSLEPGGQVEQNGSPQSRLRDGIREIEAHLDLLRPIAEASGIVLLGIGAHPFHPTKELTQIPRDRYRIMRRYLPGRGELALDMMHATASLQVSFDWSDEADMISMLRTALAVTPLVTACFANSSLHLAQPSGFVSRRAWIWHHTDPDRCGLLPFAFDADFGYRRYAEWALDVPMFFLVRDGHYRAMDGTTFRTFWRDGHEGERATLADWDRHLTTLFPEVRMKRIMEVRCADAVPMPLLAAAPALWKGILYDADARAAAAALLAIDPSERATVQLDVARRGLAAGSPRGSVLALCRELAAVAREGLRRQDDPEEVSLLDPLDALLERGKSPGEIVLERWHGEWNASPARLIEHTRY